MRPGSTIDTPHGTRTVHASPPTFAAAAILAAALFGPTAQAASPQLCVPNAQGVPYWGGGPNWWAASFPSAAHQELATGFDKAERRTKDPRWRGALAVGYDTGATKIAEFRALHDSGQLLMAWSVKALPSFTVKDTALVVGLQIGNAAPTFTRLSVNASSTAAAGGAVQMTDAQTVIPGDPQSSTYLGFDRRSFAGGNWQVSAGTPLANIKVWIMPPQGNGGSTAWTIQATAATGGNSNFKIWYSMQPSVPINGDAGLVSFSWPRQEAADPAKWTFYQVFGGADHIPPTTDWAALTIGGNCRGVKIEDSDIAVYDSGGNNQWGLVSLWNKNRMTARVTNESATQMDLSGVKATWYGAAWGSQSFDLTANSWTPLSPTLGGLSNPQATSIASSAKADIVKDWSLSLAEKCEFKGAVNPSNWLADEQQPAIRPCFNSTSPTMPPPTKYRHNCVMVKLDGNYDFLRDSALVNMNFGQASVLMRDAQISALGLPKSRIGRREVFLFEDRRNMPAYRPVLKRGRLSAELHKPSLDAIELNALVLRGEKARDLKSRAALRYLAAHPELAARIAERYPSLRGAMEALRKEDEYFGIETSVSDLLAATLPTVAWHGFHDLERTVHINSVPHRILGQQSSFGLFLLHDQPYYGWLQQMSANALRSAPGVLKVTVPDRGDVPLRLRLEAVEKVKPLKDYREIVLREDQLTRPLDNPKPPQR